MEKPTFSAETMKEATIVQNKTCPSLLPKKTIA